ncbi:quinone-dependent dihydroorotate dehydrogenase [Cronbergia sp. UHCC 0137]|uniref:quinone-dependent dihydroorotate dehydrogenase n=1 Tax=Cronbergia sp. UHCC 0137 TaxID=3110239 RepID=UPI002B201038|nr:quinone-dependent dihydroorotate dehydrogenase [Cronbergia sp. UHCC 0137]MEA5618072.1 quinone-dependent dihydroorotate dehydrogenase [Cronbergia sp. UHCC 0137]
MDIYQALVSPVLFTLVKADPEWLHQQTIRSLKWLSETSVYPPTSWLNQCLRRSLCLNDPRLAQNLFGLNFSNPLGLAAGFDKDGVAAGVWSNLGFGFAELGTVTYHPQPGNPQPRLFRLPSDQAALNRMGFNNSGAEAMATRLKLSKQELILSPVIPIGLNLGKSKITPLEASAQDYLNSFQLLQDLGDYFVVNVSSPNTPGLRSLQDGAMLSQILDTLQQANGSQKPIFVKIAPDLSWEAISDIIAIAKTYKLTGIIATNTTISREGLKTQVIEKTGKSPQAEAGGISGSPLRDRSTEVIRYIYQQTQGEIVIIGVGGIFTPEDAWEKIIAGASLIQVYTGWIYQGPMMVRRILTGLLVKLAENGFTSIGQAVGSATKT